MTKAHLLTVLVSAGACFVVACDTQGSGASKDAENTAAPSKTVTLYCAWDDRFSKPIAQKFQDKTGIKVEFVGDQEVNKTSGLRARLVSEKENPHCDVFWNNEIGQTEILIKEGVVAPFEAQAAKAIPLPWKSPKHLWTGIAARARVIIANTEVFQAKGWSQDELDSHDDFFDAKYKGLCGMAFPTAGTTATHAAALFQHPEFDADAYFQKLKDNKVKMFASNSQVAREVAGGNLAFGWTDTDDVNVQIVAKKPVVMIFPDQGPGQIGTLVLPNSIMLIKGAPHPEEAKQLIEYLLSPEVEAELAQSDAIQAPCNPKVSVKPNWDPNKLITMNEKLDFEEVGDLILKKGEQLKTLLSGE